jgi:4Fe-4S ferredoxin
MKGDVRRRPDISRIIEVEEEPPRQHAEIQLPEVDGKLMEAVRERIAQARPKLRNAGLRKKWERTDAGDGTGGGCDCSQ